MGTELVPYQPSDRGDLPASTLNTLRRKSKEPGRNAALLVATTILGGVAVLALVEPISLGLIGFAVLAVAGYILMANQEEAATISFSCPHCSGENTYDRTGWHCNTCSEDNVGVSVGSLRLHTPFTACAGRDCTAPEPAALKCQRCNKLIMLRPQHYYALNAKKVSAGQVGIEGVAWEVGASGHPLLDIPIPTSRPSSMPDPKNMFDGL